MSVITFIDPLPRRGEHQFKLVKEYADLFDYDGWIYIRDHFKRIFQPIILVIEFPEYDGLVRIEAVYEWAVYFHRKPPKFPNIPNITA